MTSTNDFRAAVLSDLGATGSEIDELLVYNENVFDHATLPRSLVLPLADEPFVTTWEEYVTEAQEKGVEFGVLTKPSKFELFTRSSQFIP